MKDQDGVASINLQMEQDTGIKYQNKGEVGAQGRKEGEEGTETRKSEITFLSFVLKLC